VKNSSQVTQFTQSSICFRCKSKLYLFDDRTIHVRGGIYRALVFVFYIKWLFYPWPKYLQPCKGEVVISSWFGLFFHIQSSILQWTCSFRLIISCFLSTSLSSEVDFLTTKPKAKLISWRRSQNFVFAFALDLFFHLYSFFWRSRILCGVVESQNTFFAILLPASRFC
jgi:hypothetical protein